VDIGDRIKALRKQRPGLTQRKLAQAIGVASGTLGMYEVNRRRPDYATLVKIAEFFGVSTDELLGRQLSQQREIPARDSWKEAPDFPAALLLISEIQDAHGLSPAQAMDMVKEASEFFNFRLPDMDTRQKAAHTSGKASLGGSGIFRKSKRKRE